MRGVPAARTGQRFAQGASRLDHLTKNVHDLVAGLATLNGRLERVDRRLEAVDGCVDGRRGTVHQRGAVRPRMVAGAVGAPATRMHPVPPDDLAARVDAATSAGVLTDQEADAVDVANGVCVWDRGNGAGPVSCVDAASLTPGRIEVERAATRATAMRARGGAWRRVQSPGGPIQL